MTAFLALAIAMSAAALAMVVPALLRRPRPGSGLTRGTANARIHAAELAALEHEYAAGATTLEAHQAARDELLHRALSEAGDKRPGAAPADGRMAAAAVVLAVPAIAAALYLAVGNPVALHRGEDAAPVTAVALEAHLEHAPRDGRGWITLARLHMEDGRFGAAVRAYEQALAVAPRIANDAQAWCELADAIGMAQGGTLRGRPRELIEKALAMAPRHPRALEMAGSAAYEAGQYPLTLQYWRELLAQLPEGSAAYRELELAVSRVQRFIAGATQSH